MPLHDRADIAGPQAVLGNVAGQDHVAVYLKGHDVLPRVHGTVMSKACAGQRSVAPTVQREVRSREEATPLDVGRASLEDVARNVTCFLDLQGSVLVLKVSDEPLNSAFSRRGSRCGSILKKGQQAKPVSTLRSSHAIALSVSQSTAYTQAIW